MKRKYHVVNSSSKGAAKTLRNFCQANGQMLLPLVGLISEARVAVDEIIDQAGRCLIETILTVNGEQVAGEKTPGKASGEVRWHGRQKGRVRLADRQLRVERPRLRRKSGGEVGVPAYQALREGEQSGDQFLDDPDTWPRLRPSRDNSLTSSRSPGSSVPNISSMRRSSGLWRDEMRDSMNWSIGKRRFWLNSRIASFWLARSCERVETRR